VAPRHSATRAHSDSGVSSPPARAAPATSGDETLASGAGAQRADRELAQNGLVDRLGGPVVGDEAAQLLESLHRLARRRQLAALDQLHRALEAEPGGGLDAIDLLLALCAQLGQHAVVREAQADRRHAVPGDFHRRAADVDHLVRAVGIDEHKVAEPLLDDVDRERRRGEDVGREEVIVVVEIAAVGEPEGARGVAVATGDHEPVGAGVGRVGPDHDVVADRRADVKVARSAGAGQTVVGERDLGPQHVGQQSEHVVAVIGEPVRRQDALECGGPGGRTGEIFAIDERVGGTIRGNVLAILFDSDVDGVAVGEVVAGGKNGVGHVVAEIGESEELGDVHGPLEGGMGKNKRFAAGDDMFMKKP
jgi:hypothetical protein